MEYDRALFRVYERIMEDLNASPSPMALSSSSHVAATSAAVAPDSAAAAAGGVDDVRGRRGGRRRGDRGRDAAFGTASPGDDDGDGPNGLEAGGRDERDNDDDDRESSRSRMPSTAADDGDERRRRRRRRRRQREADLQIIPVLARRQFSAAMQQQRRHQPLPFVLPIWMERKLDRMNHSLVGVRMMAMAESSSALAGRLLSNARAIVTGNRGAVQHSSYNSVATTSPTRQPRVPSTPGSALSLSPGASPRNIRDDFTDSNHRSHADLDVEEGGVTLELPPLNTDHEEMTLPRSSPSEGLRRRSPTRLGQNQRERSSAPRSPALQPHVATPSSSSSSSTSTSLSSRQSSAYSGEEPTSPGYSRNDNRRQNSGSGRNNEGGGGGGGGGGRHSAPAMTLAQRAIQNQLRQNQRFSPRGRRRSSRRVRDSEGDSSDGTETDDDSDDTSSEESDGSDEGGDDGDRRTGNEGCSQHNLYGVMRLSFAVAVFHVFVIVSLHVTYVGPRAFRGQKRAVPSTSRRGRGRLFKRAGVGRRDGGGYVPRGLLLGDEAGDRYATTILYNCISYALSSRPIEDRSAYFGVDKDKDGGGDGAGRRSLLEDGAGENVVSGAAQKEWYDDYESYYQHNDFAVHDSIDVRPEPSTVAVGNANYSEDEHGSPLPRRIVTVPTTYPSPQPLTLMGKDEILQIKIMYGGKCTGQCSRVREVKYPTNETDTSGVNNNNNTDGTEVTPVESQATRSLARSGLRKQGEKDARRMAEKEEGNGDDTNGSGGISTKDNDPSSPLYWEKPHYRFAIDDALLYLDERSALMHNITVVNVTVTERCLSTGWDDGKLTFLTATGQFLSQVYGMDSIIINQLMYGIRGTDGAFTAGYVKNMETQERWGWHKEQLEAFEHGSFVAWLYRKLGVMMMSTLAFFLITSVTSLIVRVLTSSGVVLMFPLFTCFRSLGMPGADERILSLSYPWIGSARVAIANGHVHPQSHLVWAHVTKIILYYVMYEACQAAWSVVLYAKSIPEALPVWIYGFAMIWEYFSMVFVRSALSVHFFPRVTFLYFFLYHAYFYSIPYGYFDVALIPLFLFMLHTMLYTILGLEAPNSARGVVNVECPREVYNRLSWPEPVAALPAEWTMFLPLNSRLSPLHDRAQTNDVNNDGNAAD